MKKTQLEVIGKQITRELANKDVQNALLKTTFKGLSEVSMRKAMFEGMMRGYTFKDFLEKNVYAIPFKDGYSLVSSIDNLRKIAMRSGLVGKSEPKFDEKDNKIVSCTITIKRKAFGEVGEYTATVYFDEYFKAGKNGYPSMWESKPHTMIAKVAEMHALRSAFPEEMAQAYIEEEFDQERMPKFPTTEKIEDYRAKLESAKDLKELRSVFASLPQNVKAELRSFADELKQKYEDLKV